MIWRPDQKTTYGTDSDDYCRGHHSYDGRYSEDSPPRCHDHKYENQCQSRAVDTKDYNEYFKGELQKHICYYDVCEIVGR